MSTRHALLVWVLSQSLSAAGAGDNGSPAALFSLLIDRALPMPRRFTEALSELQALAENGTLPSGTGDAPRSRWSWMTSARERLENLGIAGDSLQRERVAVLLQRVRGSLSEQFDVEGGQPERGSLAGAALVYLSHWRLFVDSASLPSGVVSGLPALDLPSSIAPVHALGTAFGGLRDAFAARQQEAAQESGELPVTVSSESQHVSFATAGDAIRALVTGIRLLHSTLCELLLATIDVQEKELAAGVPAGSFGPYVVHVAEGLPPHLGVEWTGGALLPSGGSAFAVARLSPLARAQLAAYQDGILTAAVLHLARVSVREADDPGVGASPASVECPDDVWASRSGWAACTFTPPGEGCASPLFGSDEAAWAALSALAAGGLDAASVLVGARIMTGREGGREPRSSMPMDLLTEASVDAGSTIYDLARGDPLAVPGTCRRALDLLMPIASATAGDSEMASRVSDESSSTPLWQLWEDGGALSAIDAAEEDVEWLQAEADGGDRAASGQLGSLLSHGVPGAGLRQDPVAAARQLDIAARNGDVAAGVHLAVLAMDTLSAPESAAIANSSRIMELLRAGEEQGLSNAYSGLGFIYQTGSLADVPVNMTAAVHYLRLAAERGDSPSSHSNLAALYLTAPRYGTGVGDIAPLGQELEEEDPWGGLRFNASLARDHLEQALSHGPFAPAEFNLGIIELQGLDKEEEEEEEEHVSAPIHWIQNENGALQAKVHEEIEVQQLELENGSGELTQHWVVTQGSPEAQVGFANIIARGDYTWLGGDQGGLAQAAVGADGAQLIAPTPEAAFSLFKHEMRAAVEVIDPQSPLLMDAELLDEHAASQWDALSDEERVLFAKRAAAEAGAQQPPSPPQEQEQQSAEPRRRVLTVAHDLEAAPAHLRPYIPRAKGSCARGLPHFASVALHHGRWATELPFSLPASLEAYRRGLSSSSTRRFMGWRSVAKRLVAAARGGEKVAVAMPQDGSGGSSPALLSYLALAVYGSSLASDNAGFLLERQFFALSAGLAWDVHGLLADAVEAAEDLWQEGSRIGGLAGAEKALGALGRGRAPLLDFSGAGSRGAGVESPGSTYTTGALTAVQVHPSRLASWIAYARAALGPLGPALGPARVTLTPPSPQALYALGRCAAEGWAGVPPCAPEDASTPPPSIILPDVEDEDKDIDDVALLRALDAHARVFPAARFLTDPVPLFDGEEEAEEWEEGQDIVVLTSAHPNGTAQEGTRSLEGRLSPADVSAVFGAGSPRSAVARAWAFLAEAEGRGSGHAAYLLGAAAGAGRLGAHALHATDLALAWKLFDTAQALDPELASTVVNLGKVQTLVEWVLHANKAAVLSLAHGLWSCVLRHTGPLEQEEEKEGLKPAPAAAPAPAAGTTPADAEEAAYTADANAAAQAHATWAHAQAYGPRTRVGPLSLSVYDRRVFTSIVRGTLAILFAALLGALTFCVGVACGVRRGTRTAAVAVP